MLFLYSILLSLGFLLMLPLFILRREKYASGFRERFGGYPKFENDGRPVIWLHCVSVGETNAARPLVDAIRQNFPNHRLIVSTTTKTGQELARKVFAEKADAVFYFPFDWKFSVRKALDNYKPSIVLLMETEIWPRFIREAKRSGARVAIVNGRLSERSVSRYRFAGPLIRNVLSQIDLALMQGEADATRIKSLGMDPDRVAVTGNLKFDLQSDASDRAITESLGRRFGISNFRSEIANPKPLIVAASTHDPEEKFILESLHAELGHSCRLMIVPRHPERFDAVARLLHDSPYTAVRRSSPGSESDLDADIILLDSIGELRSVYPLADIVFVGGSLIPHGGQNVIEPAFEGKAVVTGPYTANFESVVREFLKADAIRQIAKAPDESQISERLHEEFAALLESAPKRSDVGRRAAAVVAANRNAVERTIEILVGFVR